MDPREVLPLQLLLQFFNLQETNNTLVDAAGKMYFKHIIVSLQTQTQNISKLSIQNNYEFIKRQEC